MFMQLFQCDVFCHNRGVFVLRLNLTIVTTRKWALTRGQILVTQAWRHNFLNSSGVLRAFVQLLTTLLRTHPNV